jgi:hypothetical protein
MQRDLTVTSEHKHHPTKQCSYHTGGEVHPEDGAIVARSRSTQQQQLISRIIGPLLIPMVPHQTDVREVSLVARNLRTSRNGFGRRYLQLDVQSEPCWRILARLTPSCLTQQHRPVAAAMGWDPDYRQGTHMTRPFQHRRHHW